MRADQPKVVYLPSHNIEKADTRTHSKTQPKLKVRKSKQLVEINANIGDW